ncbi:MAG TPA: alkaline phosphatase family protein [bacterium]|nr:alkaline phosphatase family protein [bacterium]
MLPSAANPDQQMERLRWPAREGFYRPDYGRALTGVFPTLFALLGHAPAEPAPLLQHLPAGSPRRAKRVLLLCLDAFGFKELAQSRRFAALYPEHGTWITSVFPTITSCALSSIYQALPPARHGITGHVIWKDFPGAVVDMLRMTVPGAAASLNAAGFDVNRWKREPGILDTANGVPDGYHLMNRHIVGSGLSQLIYGRTRLVGYVAALEGFTKAARMLEALDTGWVGVYMDDVDSLSHVLTGDAPQMGRTVRRIEDDLAWMAGQLPRAVAEETALVVVADHGQSNIRETLPLYGEAQEWLAAHTRAVGNSGRVLHLYLDPGQEAPVAAWLREFVGDKGQVFTFDEIKALTGPPLDGTGGGTDAAHEAWLRRSLGDLVVLLDDGCNWQRRDPAKPQGPYESQLVSQHGSLTWNELFVPFLVAPLSALLDT